MCCTEIWIEEANSIFQQFVKRRGENDQRNKQKKINGCYYYITYSDNIFYLVFAELSFSENSIFDMIDYIHRQGISKMTERGKGLSQLAKDNLQNIMKDIVNKSETNPGTDSRYNSGKTVSSTDSSVSNTVLSMAQGDVNSLHVEMKENVKKAMNNLEQVNIIDEKSASIRDGSLLYKNLAADYRRRTWWNSKIFKFGMIAICLILVGIIILWAFT